MNSFLIGFVVLVLFICSLIFLPLIFKMREKRTQKAVPATGAVASVTTPSKQILPIIIGTVLLVASLAAVYYYLQPSLFWMLVVGIGVLWSGMKLSKNSNKTTRVWGQVFQGIGGLVIVVALLNSGVRTVAENSVNWANDTLNELATGESVQGVMKQGALALNSGPPVYVEVDLRHANVGTTSELPMGYTTIALVKIRNADLKKDGDVYFWACPETVWPAKLPFAPKFEVVAGAYTTQNHIALTKESKQALMDNGTSAIQVRFTFAAKRTSPCPNLKQVGSS